MKISKTVLKNGLKVVLVPRAGSLSATVMIMVATGSNYESAKENGLAHFLEHMCFKGTKRRPGASDIATELDGLGAKYNAFTSNEFTGYYATVESHNIAQAFDIVTDIYLNSQFNEGELNKERGVIIEEINMYEDMPARQVHEHLAKLLYGHQPAGRGVAGTKDTVRKITRADMVNYRHQHYVPAATTVVVTGNFKPAEIKSLLKKHFSKLPKKSTGKKLPVLEKQSQPALTLKYKKSDQTHLAFGFRSKHLKHQDAYALEVLATVLGGGMSSRLFKKIRDELGAAYYVWANNDLYTDHGIFTVAVGADTKRATLITETILAECQKLKAEPVGEAELKRMKDYLIGTMILGLESNSDLATFLAGQITLKGEFDSPAEIERKIKAVTARDLKRLANELFKPERLNLAVIGPFKEDKAFVKVLLV
ncbi:MAG: pitrilysin family protein [bacterium]|nr:pitrilysin family protein [bacterium]